MQANIPLFTCPDPGIEEIYYFRWWTWRKNIKQTPLGFIVTEFLKPVKHAAEFNALSCALGHHIAEGRWLHDPQYIRQDRSNSGCAPARTAASALNLHQFSGWTAAALYEKWLADGNRDLLRSFPISTPSSSTIRPGTGSASRPAVSIGSAMSPMAWSLPSAEAVRSRTSGPASMPTCTAMPKLSQPLPPWPANRQSPANTPPKLRPSRNSPNVSSGTKPPLSSRLWMNPRQIRPRPREYPATPRRYFNSARGPRWLRNPPGSS